jgi:DUF971 family protein
VKVGIYGHRKTTGDRATRDFAGERHESANNLGKRKACDYQAARLRRACPCAQCVNEWTGERTLKPEAISDEVEIQDLSVVGRYALNFRWSDGHETGIYSFQYLRDLCDA